MAQQEGSGSKLPPGVGKYHAKTPLGRDAHFRGFSEAFANALENVGREPGDYTVNVTFSVLVHVENPGSVVEYIATIV